MAYTPIVPADVPESKRDHFIARYQRISKGTDRLFLFAADHKIEHLNDDFYGKNIPIEAQFPAHLFELAQSPEVGAFASHFGLIMRYAKLYPSINYIFKLNGKTNLANHAPWWQKPFTPDPYSHMLWNVNQAVHAAQQTNINLCGVGCTIYLGSAYEGAMLAHAAQMIYEAHQQGLVAMVWIYPRGRAVTKTNNAHLAAGAAGVAHSLGADFVKIHPPKAEKNEVLADDQLKQVATAAGNTGVLCSGGSRIEPKILLQTIYHQLQNGDMRGCAIGRNIFELPIAKGQELVKAISAIVYESKTPEQVYHYLLKE